MINLLLEILTFIFMQISYMLFVSEKNDRAFLIRTAFIAFFIIGILGSISDHFIPFSSGGDDFRYYNLSNNIHYFSELNDPLYYRDYVEQIGYNWILGLVNILFSPSLYGFKVFNLEILIITALTWYKIGLELENSGFARRVFTAFLLISPLWYYTFFLLKDIIVVLIQSTLILGLIFNWRGKWGLGFLIIAASNILILPFRAPLLAQNVFVVVASIGVQLLAPTQQGRRQALILAGLVPCVAILYFSSNENFMNMFGVFNENRFISTSSLTEQANLINDYSIINRSIFPIIYLLSETSALNSESWAIRDDLWLRGVLALPWIMFVVPSFIFGLGWVFKAHVKSLGDKGLAGFVLSTRFVNTPWSVLVIFIISSLGISWVVGDTTRWRISDMPAIITISAAAWHYKASNNIQKFVIYWIVGSGLAFVVYYALFK